MSHHLAARRRLIRANGRPMVLRRSGQPDCALIGFARAYRPDELAGGIAQGDQQVELLADEMEAANLGAPAKGDRLVIDGHTATVHGSRAIHHGALLIGHSVWVRG